MDEITLKLNSKQNYKNNIETNKFDSNNKLKELKNISNQFESIFINQILKQARQNKIENGLFDSEAINTFNSMIDEQYSEILSKKMSFLKKITIHYHLKMWILNFQEIFLLITLSF